MGRPVRLRRVYRKGVSGSPAGARLLGEVWLRRDKLSFVVSFFALFGYVRIVAAAAVIDWRTSGMTKSKSSRRWLDRHFGDAYVKRAQQEGYRSRAAFKLLEMQDRDRLLRRGMTVVDLGAAPGGWSQVARRLVGDAGRVLALDVLPMDPVSGVTFVLGDFREEAVLAGLHAALAGAPVDLVLSDMAPNVSGVAAVDQPRALYLCELALDLACKVLKPKGALVVKAFQGEGFDAYVRELRRAFAQVYTRKPEASRSESREVYLVAKGFTASGD
jgi:23S rRNA (uridine2552-2'-O)-methyltransferase